MSRTLPAVFVVGDTYHIMVYQSEPSLMWVKIGDKTYYDELNGILRSETIVHRMIVPIKELDKYGKYTICERKIIERVPYFTKTEEAQETEFDFRPVKSGKVRSYHIADAHNLIKEPIAAAKTFGEIDFLILNGDISEDGDRPENILNVFLLCEALTGGNIPVIFSRGNHDMRGALSETFTSITPTDNGKSYYTFKVGDIWGILLDCGEDKPDGHAAYGNTIACRGFKLRQTQFLENIIADSENEYEKEGIKHRVVISHIPFTQRFNEPFNIDEDIYENWVRLLRESVSPHMILTGHMHEVRVNQRGSDADAYNQPCPVVIGAKPDDKGLFTGEKCYFTGCGIEFDENSITITFTDSEGNISNSEKIR